MFFVFFWELIIINKTKELKTLEDKILNVNRGILALRFDVMNEIKNASRLTQMLILREIYEKEFRELKKGTAESIKGRITAEDLLR